MATSVDWIAIPDVTMSQAGGSKHDMLVGPCGCGATHTLSDWDKVPEFRDRCLLAHDADWIRSEIEDCEALATAGEPVGQYYVRALTIAEKYIRRSQEHEAKKE